MNFQKLVKVETYQKYLDIAFSTAAKQASLARSKAKGSRATRLIKSRKIELERVTTVKETLANSLKAIVDSFPRVDELAPFYNELVRCTLDRDELKNSLGMVNWAAKQVIALHKSIVSKIKGARNIAQINIFRTEFYGRVSSVLKQIKTALEYLENARKTMRNYPTLKTAIPTVVIAGAPNVGKSTLLAALTGSKPEIAPYPFTTKRLMIGYEDKKVQYVDTPGLLDRPLEKRNPIERQAILALKHLAQTIIFVFDPTEICGYSIESQLSLYKELEKNFKVPIIAVANKADIQAKPLPVKAIPVSAKEKTGVRELRQAINSVLNLF